MFKTMVAVCAAILLSPVASLAADEAATPLRLIGEAGPARFVIDAVARPSDEAGEREVEGWAGAFPPSNDNGAVDGKCARGHCELKIDLENRELHLSGDLLVAKGPVQGHFEVTGDVGDEQKTKGAASFTPFADTVPGLGQLAKPDAIDSQTLDDLLLWQSIDPAFGDDDVHPIASFQHEHIASWQLSSNRPVNGLLLADDIALLESLRSEAQKKVGWVQLGAAAQGWRAGYPAALLPKASQAGAERSFESADGKARLVIAIDPPLSSDDFDALSAKLHQQVDTEADANTVNYTRSQSDIEFSYTKAGKAIAAVYYGRKGGLARLVYTYPAGEGPLADIDSMVTRSLRVTDDLKPGP